MTINWQPQEKPPAGICPQKYCFFWKEKDSWSAPGLYENLQEALQNAQLISEGQCGCSWGICLRLNPLASERDLYEPHEPFLEYDGLPWFYFIPHPSTLRGESRQKYILESEKLWGKKHWLK